MNKMTTFQPSARMMAVLNRSLKDQSIDARWSEDLAQFAQSKKAIEMVAEGFGAFLEVAEPFMADGDLDMTKIIASATDSVAAAKSSEDVTKALSAALMEAEHDRAGDPSVASLDARAPGGMTVAEYRKSGSQGTDMVARMTDGFLARVKPGHEPTIGREFAGMSLFDHARMSVESTGQRLWGKSKARVVEMAMHSTSDFPNFLQSTSQRLLVDAYEAAESGIKVVSQRLELQDFREVHNLRLGAAPDLEELSEQGEVKHGTIEEAKESIKLTTYAKIFALTRQAIVNDDLSAFDRLLPDMGAAAARKEAQILVSLLEQNSGAGPDMGDGNALFHTDHGNLAGTGEAITVASISAARTAMRRQKGIAGEPINVNPAYLIVPPELETIAQQVLTEIYAAQVSEVNPFTGRMEAVVDPYLTDTNRWYAAAPAGRPVGLQHAYLQGEPGPQLFTQEGFDVEGMKFKVRLDFGAAFADWRAWHMNPGS